MTSTMELRGRVISKKIDEDSDSDVYCACCSEDVSDLRAHCLAKHVSENERSWKCKFCELVSGYPKPTNLMSHANKCWKMIPLWINLNTEDVDTIAWVPGRHKYFEFCVESVTN